MKFDLQLTLPPFPAAIRHLALYELQNMQLKEGMRDFGHSLEYSLPKFNERRKLHLPSRRDLLRSCTEQASKFDGTYVSTVFV